MEGSLPRDYPTMPVLRAACPPSSMMSNSERHMLSMIVTVPRWRLSSMIVPSSIDQWMCRRVAMIT